MLVFINGSSSEIQILCFEKMYLKDVDFSHSSTLEYGYLLFGPKTPEK